MWRTDAFELCCWRRLLSPLDCKEIQPLNPKGNQPWIYIGRADAKAEAPKLWPPDVKSWLMRKDPDGEKDWRQKERGQQRMRRLDGITDSVHMSLSNSRRWWRAGEPDVLGAINGRTWLRDWTTTSLFRSKHNGHRGSWTWDSRALRRNYFHAASFLPSCDIIILNMWLPRHLERWRERMILRTRATSILPAHVPLAIIQSHGLLLKGHWEIQTRMYLGKRNKVVDTQPCLCHSH